MSRYRAYPEYKDSGVEWLGEIPPHWSISKLRYGFSFGKGLSITKENLVDEGIPCVSYGEVHSRFGFEVDPSRHALKCVDESYLKSSSESLIKNGDFVFADTSEDVEGSGNFTQLRSEEITFAGYHTIIARPNNRKSARYFAYLFDSKPFRTQIRYAVKGVKVFSVTQAILRGADIWLPSQDEQEKIAAFLDHETAKIDALIEKQQRLIELLKEKRQAVISHAVTKGLNPNAPMKDSGVEWLGEVPAHWKIASLKYLVSKPIIDGPHVTPTKHDDGVPFVSAEAISKGFIDFEKIWGYISEKDHETYSKRYSPEVGDIFMVKLGATTGAVAIVETDDIFSIWVPIAAIRINKKIPSRYFFYLLQSSNVRDAIQLSWTFGTQQTLGLGTLSNLSLPVPSVDECAEIIEAIESKIPILDNSILKSERSIALLQERRTALISAAVTGKIDVRDWQPVATQEEAGSEC